MNIKKYIGGGTNEMVMVDKHVVPQRVNRIAFKLHQLIGGKKWSLVLLRNIEVQNGERP